MAKTPDHRTYRQRFADRLSRLEEEKSSEPDAESDELGSGWYRTQEYRTLLLWARQAVRTQEK